MDFLKNQKQALTHPEKPSFVFLLFVMAGFSVLCSYAGRWLKKRHLEETPYRNLLFTVMEKSLPLAGATLFVFAVGHWQDFFAASSSYRAAAGILVLALFVLWAHEMAAGLHKLIPRLFTRQALALWNALVLAGAAFALSYFLLAQALPVTGPILTLWRQIFALVAIFGLWIFWHIVFRLLLESGDPQECRLWRNLSFIRGVSLAAIVGGPLLDFSGYSLLADYWYHSWVITSAVVAWGFFSGRALSEYERLIRPGASKDGDTETSADSGYPFRWLITRICWLVWIGGAFAGMLFAWGAGPRAVSNLAFFLNYPVNIGTMQFSLQGLFYAFVVLFFTHAATHLWRQVLREHILAESGMGQGAKESITTISVYLVWGVGILIALNAFGLSTTSMAVVFGALGIGLGFGLQNIFNNFVSGIILLFERPIQVGDALQFDKTWGVVTRINVRSTVVQTYDNASLIIPNSELLSRQVTNWSFKDMRLRRWITVGVEYGSNIELARKILLEIADRTPHVLKYPKPDVLFSDFGDSSLVFNLRYWTSITHMLTTETEIRFAIDRRFKEAGIVIAFPQQDIHIKSLPKDFPWPPVKGRGPDSSTPDQGLNEDEPEKDKALARKKT